jgi:diguanylate cyclase (GGDEF)-like protein/PAS domain S-box-containing protein
MAATEPPDDLFLFRALMGTAADSIFFKDRDCRLIRANRMMATSLGFADPAELIGKTDIELFGEEFGRRTRHDDLRVMETRRSIVGQIEGRLMDNGQTNWTLSSKMPLYDDSGNVIGLVGITHEINEIRQAEVALQHLATHDTLTDLPNRFLLVDRINQLAAHSFRAGTAFAILYMDIDGFKEINDNFGHDVGDQVLRAVAQRLTRAVRQSDTVARIGGDEFVVIVEALNAHAGPEIVATKVEQALATPLILGGHRVKVGVSIGIAFYPVNATDTDTLLRMADQAMYQAKREGGNRYRVCARPG